MSRELGVPVAVKHRLLQVARLRKEEFEQLLVRYVAERFLYRLSMSRFADAFLLKGAMLLIAWQGSPHRVTRDVDLLGLGECSTAGVSEMLREVALARAYDDGVTYDVGSLETQTIRALSGAGGVRVTLWANVGTARVKLQVDVGFGDAVSPAPERIEFPSILDQPRALLGAYPMPTFIAEKTMAIVERGFRNTRLKDYFDVHYLSQHWQFQAVALAHAMRATSVRRGTPIQTCELPGLSGEFSSDQRRQLQWSAFCTRIAPQSTVEPLPAVVHSVSRFLGPILVAVATDTSPSALWTPGGPWR